MSRPPVKVLVTGARGFIGRNLVVCLRREGIEVVGVDSDADRTALADGVRDASVVFHLAGVNRPEPVDPADPDAPFVAGNVGPLEALVEAIAETGARPAIVLSSSTQVADDNPYGRSKRQAERVLEDAAARHGLAAVIYRLPGVFGRWCRPDYNSVVATFCHRIARDLPITISDPDRVVTLTHVDDVVAAFRTHVSHPPPSGMHRGEVQPQFSIRLADLAGRLRAFRAARTTLEVADATDPLTRRLLATYLTYLDPTDLAYPLTQRTDDRGVLAELLKSSHFGQIFVSRTRPGVTRGHHYHDLKVEKFCVLEGQAVIRFRPVQGGEVTAHRVCGRDFTVVDIPPGMAHSIENVGDGELITLFWASEIFDPARPDTYPSEVRGG